MKKVLIVNDNMELGGIQKSLINLLSCEFSDIDISLLLFSSSGELMQDIPERVHIIRPLPVYQVLGLNREQLKKKPLLYVLKAFCVILCRITGKRRALAFLGLFQKKIRGYDVVISYSHLTNHESFFNCCGEFVLDKTESSEKICMIHCDYIHSGHCSEINNSEYDEFDSIACCSESVRKRFLDGSGISGDKVHVLRNFYNDSVHVMSLENTYSYNEAFINIVIAARLSEEKGIDIALDSLKKSGRKDIRLYIIGDGPLEKELHNLTERLELNEQVFFMGKTYNPYRYMRNADYLLVPSRHEAAPIVYDEAHILGIPVISSITTSTMEMLDENDYITDNLTLTFSGLSRPERNNENDSDNSLQKKQFEAIIG